MYSASSRSTSGTSGRTATGTARPLAASEADNSGASRRRRMAMMKYGSTTSSSSSSRRKKNHPSASANGANTTTTGSGGSGGSRYSMHKTREHTRQLAKATASFADFSAFGMPPQQPSSSQDPPLDHLFDRDPFAASTSSSSQPPPPPPRSAAAAAGFAPDWPSAGDEPQHQRRQPRRPSQQSQQAIVRTPERGPRHYQQELNNNNTPSQHSSPSPSYASSGASGGAGDGNNGGGGGGGAASRRRMRNQMRKAKTPPAPTTIDNGSSSTSQPPPQQHTPPQSPYSKRGAVKSTDHLAHYSVSHANGPPTTARQNSFSNRSTGSNSNSAANTSSVRSAPSFESCGSAATPQEVDLFDPSAVHAGFTFDAFGLDASQIQREVSEAMHDIAGSHPDLSFFLDRDPADDDFAAANRGWESSSPGPASRSSTPEPVANTAGGQQQQQDGFVDGFRVAKSSAAAFPVMQYNVTKQSPTSTDRSSLTSETSLASSSEVPPNQQQGGRRNLFKELARNDQAPRRNRIVRPNTAAAAAGGSGTVVAVPLPQQSQQQQQRGVVPRMPDLDDSKPPSVRSFQQHQPRQQQQQQQDEREQMSPTRGTSDTGAPSDAGVASDFGVDDIFDEPALDVMSQLKRDKKQQQQKNLEEEEQEEKKYDEPDDGNSTGISSVTNLRAQWQKRDLIRPQMQTQEEPAAVKLPPRSPSQVQRLCAATKTTAFSTRMGPTAPRRPGVVSPTAATATTTTAAAASSRSEAGAALRVDSQVNRLLGSWQREQSPANRSLRDSQSDVGTPTSASSPSFAAVKLRRTGFHGAPNDNNDPADATTSTTTANTASTSRSPGNWRDRDQLKQEEEEEEELEPEQPNYTYRERREMELQRQREEEEEEEKKQQASQQANERDVAALIRRRIAANKKNSSATSPASEGEERNGMLQPQLAASTSSLSLGGGSAFGLPNRRSMEEKQQGSDDLTPTRRMQTEQPPLNHERSSRTSPKPDLVIETRSDQNANAVPGSGSAVSRLHMLEQVQQLQPIDPAELSAAAPASSSLPNNNHCRPETPDPHPEDQNYAHKAHTPKATKMMLNAFLAGRESLSSGDALSGVRGSHSDENQQGADTTAAEDSKDTAHRLPALKDDPKYERYFKMLKFGMPMDVVKHAMIRDGLDTTVMDGDHNKPVGVPLKHDSLYSKYFKMLGVGLPMEAVKHAMERDGLDSTVMDQDHDLPIHNHEKKDDSEGEEPKEKDSHRRARLHWKPLRKVTSNSLWAQIDEDELLGNIEIDEEEFQELFQVEKNTESTPSTLSSAFGVKRGAVRVIDAKRANNGGIILARLKMSHDDMADAVDHINENALTAEQIENIIEYLPTREERKALEMYMLEGGQDAAEKFEALCECEKFMVSMMTVKHAKRKVRALLFKLQFQTCLEDIHNDTVAVETACDELVNSVRLRQLLGIVLTFGNRLNTAGNGQRKAGAFTLDSLLKLNQAKAFDKKTTFLHYIVLIVQRNNEILLRFNDDIPSVFKADKIFWDQCVTDLEEVENQLENVRKIALYQARHAMAYRFRRKKREEDEESLSDGEASLTLEEEVEALRATPVGLFTLSAIKIVSSLRDKVEETKSKFTRLLEYFGEEEGKVQPHELFNVVGTFSRDFEKAKELVFTNEKRKQREERKRQAAKGKTLNPNGQHGRPPTYSPAQPDRKANTSMLKSSNFQPSMSSILKEIKGRVPSEAPAPTGSAPITPPKQSTADQKERVVSPVRESRVASPVRESTVRVPNAPSDEYPSDADETNEPRRNGVPMEAQNIPAPEELSPVQRRSGVRGEIDPVEDSTTPSRSRTVSSSTKAALREKARIRRQRSERSSSSPATMSPISNPGQSVQATSPVQPSRSPPANDAGTLSPRSSMRLRMERRKLTQAS